MQARREKWIVGILIFLFLVLITSPFVYAWSVADGNHVFGGFLLNPIDGNSYLAKMREGYNGAWLFTLPYTAQPGAGAAINLYYLFLGHVARTLGLSLVITFHAARLLGALLLCLVLQRFFAKIFSDSHARLWALGLALLGSGLGWLALAFGAFTSDFWVAEGYPFLAAFANAHFPLGLALQIGLLTPLVPKVAFAARRMAAAFFAAILLSIIYPFGWLVVIAVLSAWLFVQAVRRTQLNIEMHRWLCILVGGLPFSGYSLWVVNNHPVLAQWTQQNLTPAPMLLDLLLSFSPALVFACIGAYFVSRKPNELFLFLGTWLLVGILLIYFPSNLQRRFISGLYVPVAALAVFALQNLARNPQIFRRLALGVVLFSIPTNLLILSGGLQAVRIQNPALYLERAELQAYQWLDQKAEPMDLALAGPDSGLFIPTYSNVRVIYGHPFETVQADERRSEVERFYARQLSDANAASYLESAGVDYVLYGPREHVFGPLPELPGWQIVYSAGGFEIWAPSP